MPACRAAQIRAGAIVNISVLSAHTAQKPFHVVTAKSRDRLSLDPSLAQNFDLADDGIT